MSAAGWRIDGWGDWTTHSLVSEPRAAFGLSGVCVCVALCLPFLAARACVLI